MISWSEHVTVLKPWGQVVGQNSTDYIGNKCSFKMFLSKELTKLSP